MKLSIAIPGLIWQDIGDINYISPQISCPNLDKILKRSSVATIPHSFSDLVYSSYTKSTTSSLAQAIAKDLGYTNLHTHFLLAEPTFLRADRDRLLICESELLQLDEEETALIINTVNKHFDQTVKLYPINNNLWLIGLNLDVNDNKFYPILDIIGENIDEYLPKGQNAIGLTKIINEIQMLLFNLEINQTRKQENLLQINSLWLWDKAIKSNLLNNYSQIFTNMPNLNNAKIKHIPKNISNTFIDNSLVIIDSLYYPCCYRDSYSYLHNLSVLDKELASILLMHLNQIDYLEILIPGIDNTKVIQLHKNDKYKFWKNTSFLYLLKEQNAL